MLSVLDVVLSPSHHSLKISGPNGWLYVLDGTLVPCGWWKNARKLYSEEHRRAGHNF